MNLRTHSLVRAAVCLGLCVSAGVASAAPKQETDADRVARSREAAASAYAAGSLLKKATSLLTMGEKDRGVKMLETIIEQYPDTIVRHEAYLALGRHYLDQRDQPKAISVLRHVKEMEKDDEELAGRERDIYLEGLYLTGMGYFQMKQYGAAFPVLRKITANYPNTVWANQAYYYVGMCHFAQGNWNKAIEALSLVGTFVDLDSETTQYIEAGRRFYVKIVDGDLPILYRLGKTASVTMETAHGDKESVPCVPLSLQSGVFLVSIPTAIGKPKIGDGTLQVVGGDAITTRYDDNNTQTGDKNVIREQKVDVVSTGNLMFTMGTFESKAPAAFLGQPLHVLLLDVDQDVSDNADTAAIKIVARYKAGPDEAAPEATAMTTDLTFQEEQKYKVRDEVVLTLTELGDPPVHTGGLAGSLEVEAARENEVVSKTDKILTCAIGDEIVATYVDEKHIGGQATRTAIATILVAGKIDSRLSTSVNFVPDAILKAKKNLVEGTAYLELARIFASMGLKSGAKTKADDGLERVDTIIRLETPIPSALKEEAFKLRWELFIVQEDFQNAMATCQLFNRLYPDSPFVDQAMMGIGRIRFESRQYPPARQVFQQVLRLPNSLAKAEAQFMIAKSIETEAEEKAALAAARGGANAKPYAGLSEQAIREYKLCAERYPDSQYAGESLGKLVDYYLQTRDYPRADDLLEQIFQDYPDAGFLDEMLLKWVYVAYLMGNFKKAEDKCTQLVFEYPASTQAAKAKELLPTIQAELGRGPTSAPSATTR